MSGKVRDLAEFLAELGPVAPRHPLPVTAAYHDACHLAHAQRITRQPRELLRAIPGLKLVELPDAGTCCGSAGVYNLLQPEAASELGARKAEAVLATGAPLLISANPGCSLQIASALADRGEHIAVAHTAEVLDASIMGRSLRPARLAAPRLACARPDPGRAPSRRGPVHDREQLSARICLKLLMIMRYPAGALAAGAVVRPSGRCWPCRVPGRP